jgi:hypothetical protein
MPLGWEKDDGKAQVKMRCGPADALLGGSICGMTEGWDGLLGFNLSVLSHISGESSL